MIDKVLLENFQCHERLSLKFDAGITTIVGASDEGKSAILRALRWVFFNQPRGDDFVRWGAKWVRVRVKLDGRTLIRQRCGGENLYKLDDQEYRAFGTGVPEQIKELLRLSEYNFQGQHDPPFLVGLSAPELARQLNRLVDLDVIDTVMSKLESRIRKSKCEEDIVCSRLRDAECREQSTRYALELDEQLKQLESSEVQIAKLKNRVFCLSGLIRVISDNLYRLGGLKELLEETRRLVQLGDSIGHYQSRVERLGDLLANIDQLQRKAQIRVPNLQKLTELATQCKDLAARWSHLSDLVTGIKRLQEDFKSNLTALQVARELIREETKGVCPVCGSKWVAW